jgi:chlorite dismutase
MKAYKHLIKYALAKDCTISVWDGEEWQVKHSTKFNEINSAVESVEEAALRIRSATGEVLVNSVTVSAFGLEDDETIVDYTVCPFMDAYEAATA